MRDGKGNILRQADKQAQPARHSHPFVSQKCVPEIPISCVGATVKTNWEQGEPILGTCGRLQEDCVKFGILSCLGVEAIENIPRKSWVSQKGHITARH